MSSTSARGSTDRPSRFSSSGRRDLKPQPQQGLRSYGSPVSLAESERRRRRRVPFAARSGCSDLAVRRSGEDNITAVVASFDGDLPPMTTGERISGTLFVIQEFQPPK